MYISLFSMDMGVTMILGAVYTVVILIHMHANHENQREATHARNRFEDANAYLCICANQCIILFMTKPPA